MIKMKKIFLALLFLFSANSIRSAVKPSDLKISAGPIYYRALGLNNWALGADVQYMVNEKYELTGGLAASVASGSQDAKNYYFYNGINIRFWNNDYVVPYVGGRGALVTFFASGAPTAIHPLINLYAGFTTLFGNYFSEVEAGYAIYGNGVNGEVFQDHSGFRAKFRFGVRLNMAEKTPEK